MTPRPRGLGYFPFAIGVPAVALAAALDLIHRTSGPFQRYQPPTNYRTPWDVPPVEPVGINLLGGRLYDPLGVRAKALVAASACIALIALGVFAYQSVRAWLEVDNRSALARSAPTFARALLWVAPLYSACGLFVMYAYEIETGGMALFSAALAGIVALCWLWYLAMWARGVAPRPTTRLQGHLLRDADSPLVRETTRLASRFDGAPPDHIVLTLLPAPGVIVGRADCGGDELQGVTLLIPVSLCRILSEAEMSAHIALLLAGLNSPASRERVARWRIGETLAVAAHRHSMARTSNFATSLAAIGSIPGMILCLLASQGVLQDLSSLRRDVLEQDAAAARECGAVEVGSALAKSTWALALWERLDLSKLVRSGGCPGGNVSEYLAARFAATEMLAEAFDAATFGLSLRTRLRNIDSIWPKDASKLAVPPLKPALRMIPGFAEIEASLCADWRRTIVLD